MRGKNRRILTLVTFFCISPHLGRATTLNDVNSPLMSRSDSMSEQQRQEHEPDETMQVESEEQEQGKARNRSQGRESAVARGGGA